MKKILFEVDGQKLQGTLFYPKKLKLKNPAILFVHGWDSNQQRYFASAEKLAAMGYICFLFDIRGHNGSEGDINTLTTREFLDDVYAAYDYLVDIPEVDATNISAVGSSFGAYLLTIASGKKRVKRLALRVPATYPNEDFEKSKMQTSGHDTPESFKWRNKRRKIDELFSLQAINQYKGEVLITESENDESVPHGAIENYINALKDKNKLTHVIIKGAPHSIREENWRDKFGEVLIDWFKDKI